MHYALFTVIINKTSNLDIVGVPVVDFVRTVCSCPRFCLKLTSCDLCPSSQYTTCGQTIIS